MIVLTALQEHMPATMAESTRALSSRALSDLGRNFLIIGVFEVDGLVCRESVPGAHLYDLDAYVLVPFLLVEHAFDHGLVLRLACDEHASLRVLGLGAAVYADAGTTGNVAEQREQFAETRAHRHADGIDEGGYDDGQVLQRVGGFNEKGLVAPPGLAEVEHAPYLVPLGLKTV